jgi:hypothetical protein
MVWLAKSGNSIAKLRPSLLSKLKFYKWMPKEEGQIWLR